MNDYEKLNQFIYEELKYKTDVEVVYCRIVGDKFLDLKITGKGKKNCFERGEIVDLNIYKKWIKQFEREEILEKILNDKTT